MGWTLQQCTQPPLHHNNEAINPLPWVPDNKALDAMPTFDEIQEAIHLLSSGKAPGSDIHVLDTLYIPVALVWQIWKTPHEDDEGEFENWPADLNWAPVHVVWGYYRLTKT